MWKELPSEGRENYKRLILAFASLTAMFAQKSSDEGETEEERLKHLVPIINSKYQETVFQIAFKATAEDIGNTSYDASLVCNDPDGNPKKYLIGIKTFGYSSGYQKIAQFKSSSGEWMDTLRLIETNSKTPDGSTLSKEKIDSINEENYLRIAISVSKIRNDRLKSSAATIRGFNAADEKGSVDSVYHVLMPRNKSGNPTIVVGEIPYDEIDIGSLRVTGCTTNKTPINFGFTDGRHTYRYTSADSQLLMDFEAERHSQESWDVVYAKDAYAIFSDIADKVFGKAEKAGLESYSWKLANNKGEMERFSGFNSFYGVGSKLSKSDRSGRISSLRAKYEGTVDGDVLDSISESLGDFLLSDKTSDEKIEVRERIEALLEKSGQEALSKDVRALIYRPKNELYIPIPDSVNFHRSHPDFFGPGIGRLEMDANGVFKPSLAKPARRFTLVFDPSGKKIDSFITQDGGKAIQSYEKQSYLGEWILREVFQLGEYEPLTAKRMDEIGINGIRLSKDPDTGYIHLSFIWIDADNPPDDYVEKNAKKRANNIKAGERLPAEDCR